MIDKTWIVRVPATTANLGPGFDALGLALDLWNETVFSFGQGQSQVVTVAGEGAGVLPNDSHNLVAASARCVFQLAGEQTPGMVIACENHVPLSSGLGSSSAAVLSGILGANAYLRKPLDQKTLLKLAIEIEGHPDNVAPALLGGLVVCLSGGEDYFAYQFPKRAECQPFFITLAVPEFTFSTQAAREVLPKMVERSDAVYNIGRAVLVAEALALGDLGLLAVASDDRMHQPYRLPVIPGAQAAYFAAREAGAAAVTLSGAGPSLAAFCAKKDHAIGAAMQKAFADAGVTCRIFHLQSNDRGAEVYQLSNR